MDVVDFDSQTDLADLQRQDLVNFGRLILSIASNNSYLHNIPKALEHIGRVYTPQLREAVQFLLGYGGMNPQFNVNTLITLTSNHLVEAFDASLHQDDNMFRELNREVENGRYVRLMAKLNFILERPEYEHDRQWSEHGQRYLLPLFRDYVYHQVDANGNPAVDLGHALSCLGKLDAGTDERIVLISRDEQVCFVVSYKEVKVVVESAFRELMRKR